MTDVKPFASLGPSLLARKGAARPAMRPQYGVPNALGGSGAHALQPEIEDLGWNDLGEEADARSEPEIRRRRRDAGEALTSLARQAAGKRVRRSALEQGRRAAFTLRLDAERHLRLRFAATMQNRSAQSLVTEALDRFLADIDGLEGLAARLPATDTGFRKA